MSKESCTSPAVSPIDARISLKSSRLLPLSWSVALPASTEPNISTIERPFCSAYSLINVSISERLYPSLISPENVSSESPAASAASLRFLLAVVPLFPSSESVVASAVAATSVLVPCFVIRANAEDTCSNETPNAAAAGVTLESALPNSSTVVTPLFCV